MRRGRSMLRGRKARSFDREIAGIADELAALGATLGASASEEASATLQSLRRKIDRIAAKGSDAADAGVNALEKTIEETPLGSVAVALMIGFALGALIRR